MDPLVKSSLSERTLELTKKTSLFGNLNKIAQVTESLYPQTMEEIDHPLGYLLYETEVEMDAEEERLRIIDARDRVQVYANDQLIATQYQEEIGQDLFLNGKKKTITNLKLLIENMGRDNYGHKLLADTQRKGIRTGVCIDLHFKLYWKQYALDFSQLDRLDFSKEWQEGQPAFYQFAFHLDQVEDTFLDMTGFGKGIVLVNGHHIGRFWEVGPTLSLYIPHGFLKDGENEILVFETEGTWKETLKLVSQPTFKEVKGENL